MHVIARMRVPFHDRRDAGKQLAEQLIEYRGRDDVIVLGLPRGGVPVAYEMSAALEAPLDVLVVRKLGVPGHEELAMGAIASGGIRILEQRVIDAVDVLPEEIASVEARERLELDRRERTFRAGRPALDVTGKITILVDDGLATGASMAAAVDAVRTRSPETIIVAVPVAPRETCSALAQRADEVICLVTPPRMYAVGQWYEDFTQTSDEEVRALLERAALEHPAVPMRTDEVHAPMR
jgi:predicted phosphoribosyltransferase